ncbi:endo alpha-1,4 polygalactosaminidase [Megasphaera hominis]|jgi:cysteinyl-tRNA synthetase|uniref:Endo alpha-1,4 polygalactosaminidase n=1 Tax=Megasphaera hominis TaxID=159836 RepID=A0ABR6VH85_9FIRM|nr:endo alpha-1,4 polygalactosaminidase [Megasphaera hominis]MBC3536611.1 endo alpha-1,4 polygalactosaminidase [Megasphaera hominis]
MRNILSACLVAGSLVTLLLSGCGQAAATADTAVNPKQEMVTLAAELRHYSRQRQPSFQLVGNGAAGLLEVTPDNPPEVAALLVHSLDGFLTESVFYTEKDGQDQLQAADTAAYLQEILAIPLAADKAVWTLDYVREQALQQEDEALGKKAGYVSMAVGNKNLDRLPKGKVPHVNSRDIETVQEAKNFLFLLNPEHFASREAYLAALRNTPYDVLVLDLEANDGTLTAADVASLKEKPQGGRRLVLCYLSVGEAATYRPYWQQEWQRQRPDWIAEANTAWPGSYRVRYWRPEWKHILYGSPDAYLDRIMASGFDGAFLDVMDGWQSFLPPE